MFDDLIAREILPRFPKGSLLQAGIRRYGDDPDEEQPKLELLLIPQGPKEYDGAASQASGDGSIPEDVYRAAVRGFQKTQATALQQLGKDLPRLVPECVHLAIAYGGYENSWDLEPAVEPQRGLTSVMARLDRTDLETLDTLIAAGFANSRAEAIRWALSRIRERPVYQQLQQRVSELETLKAGF